MTLPKNERDRHRHYPEFKTEDMLSMYDSGMSIVEIAEHFPMTHQSIRGRFLRAGLRMRGKNEAVKLARKRDRWPDNSGPNNYNWKGGRSHNLDGYVELRIGGNRILEHRLIWEKERGPIPNGWVIHHFNGIKDDNRIENLVAIPTTSHRKHTIVDELRKRIIVLEGEISRLKNISGLTENGKKKEE